MTTAAKKFDLVPPWCVIDRRDDKSRSWGQWIVMSHDRSKRYQPVGFKTNGDEAYMTENEALDRARHYARLTRPLDSWEPAPDCPLPVDGWRVVAFDGEPFDVWVLLDGGSDLAGGDDAPIRFPTRRAAYVWAWTEAAVTDGTGAKEGPPDDRGTLGWAAFDQLCDQVGACETKVEDTASATVKLADRIGKVEGVLARICPEADSQTDGKGRTLVEIDAALEDVFEEVSSYARRVENLERLTAESNTAATDACDTVNALKARVDRMERLSAAQVAKPATLNTRSDDASTNEAMTEAAASEEGWREQLVAYRLYDNSPPAIAWVTPDGQWMTGSFSAPTTGWWNIGKGNDLQKVWRKVEGDIPANAIKFRDSIINPPPNLAEWYKPKAALSDGTLAAPLAVVTAERDAAREAVPSTYRVGDDLAAWVRNLAKAHEQALKCQRDLERKLADANTAAVAAEGRAHTAMKRASKAEEELADLRGKVENLRAAFSG